MQTPTNDPQILRIGDVQVRIGLSRATIYRLEKAGEFPARVHLGARAVGWLVADLDAWVQSRREASHA